MNNVDLKDFSPCDVLALATIVSSEFARGISEADNISFWGDFFTAVGANLTLIAGQTARSDGRSQFSPSNKTTPQPVQD